MIKKLRRRMILINMLLVGTVILAIFIAVIYNNYSNSVSMMERGMNQVLDKQGKQFGDRREPFPEELFGGENFSAVRTTLPRRITTHRPRPSAPAVSRRRLLRQLHRTSRPQSLLRPEKTDSSKRIFTANSATKRR